MRLGQRATTIIDEGEFAGVEATVDQIIGWPVWAIGSNLRDKLAASEGVGAVMDALGELCDYYETEARPSWAIEDQRGYVPPTASGMLRLPTRLVAELYGLWLATFPRPETDPRDEPPSAVDALVPPGPVRDKLNKGLRAARKG